MSWANIFLRLSKIFLSLAKSHGYREEVKLDEKVKSRRTVDVPSPRDLIAKEDIKYDIKQRQITIKNISPRIWLTTVADTNSMDPTVDAGHTCILTTAFNPADLVVGDIVVFKALGRNILHRIIEIGEDKDGRFYRLKGDNNYRIDPYIIRDAHITYLLLGILY